MDKKVPDRVMEAFGMTNCTFGTPQKGYRNTSWPVTTPDRQTLNLILYKREPDISQTISRARTAGLLLSEAALPSRIPVDKRILQIKSGKVTQLAGLYNYLPGRTIPWEAYTMDHLKLLGKTMSDMHAAWSNYGSALPSVVDHQKQLLGHMEQYFAQVGVQRAMREKLQIADFSQVFTSFHETLLATDHLPDKQLLHMDFVRGNVLFAVDTKEPAITGIIDFEKAAYGHPLFDVARTLAFLLVDCKYKSEDKVRKYFLKSGYHKRGKQPLKLITVKQNDQSTDLLEELINLFLVYDLYKFMRHNPYESLDQNEHFTRTRDLLVKRNVITPVV